MVSHSLAKIWLSVRSKKRILGLHFVHSNVHVHLNAQNASPNWRNYIRIDAISSARAYL